MQRSFFLVSLSTLAVAATAPRLATAQSERSVTRIRRRARVDGAGVPGGCANHRRARRWASFTAADFAT